MASVQNDNWGISFSIPDGWDYRLDGARYLITSNNNDELMLVFQHNLKSKDELLTDFQKWTEGDLQPTGTTYYDLGDTSIGYGIQGTFEKVAVDGFMVAMSNANGKGLTVMVLVSNGLFEQRHAELAAYVSSTVSFFERKINLASDFPEWQSKLANKRLHYLESYSSNTYGGGGYSREQKIALYPDMSFTYSWQSLTYGLASSTNTDSGVGYWRIATGAAAGPVLELNLDDGRQFTYDLVESAGLIYLNGQKHFLERL